MKATIEFNLDDPTQLDLYYKALHAGSYYNSLAYIYECLINNTSLNLKELEDILYKFKINLDI